MYALSNKIIDLISGFDLDGELKKVLQMDGWSRSQWNDYQKKQFIKLKEHACKSSFFKKFKNKELKEFPIIDKEIFRTQQKEFFTHYRGKSNIIHTSGSTAKPMGLVVSKEMILAKRTAHIKMLSWYGLKREAREMKVGGFTAGKKKQIYHYFRNKKHFGSKQLDKKIHTILNKMNRYRPEVLVGYPSALSNLAYYAIKHDIELHKPSIIVTHAENQTELFKCHMQQTFGNVPLINQYWSTEANIGASCSEGNVHIDEDTVICELDNVDSEGTGDLLITNLYSFHQPIIRYKIGDRVKLSSKACPCGRQTKIIEKIEGRTSEFIQLNNGSRIYYTGNSAVFAENCKNIHQFQLVYSKSQDLLKFKYIRTSKQQDIDARSIKSYFTDQFQQKVILEEVEILDVEKSGKFKPYLTVD